MEIRTWIRIPQFRILAALVLFVSIPSTAKPGFTELQFNPNWYRTFDSTSDILPAKGELLYNWIFSDPENTPDSFYVGIDTLWALPQNVGGDSASDWDLQICPDEICLNGLKAGIHGANAPYAFEEGHFKAEHHFQFFPAVDSKSFQFTAPAQSLMGALMYCRSRTTGLSDTVLGFGTWNLKWDPDNLPPIRPRNGYLPRRSDFVIEGNTVKYLAGNSGVRGSSRSSFTKESRMEISSQQTGFKFRFKGLSIEKEIRLYSPVGRLLWTSGKLGASTTEFYLPAGIVGQRMGNKGCILAGLVWHGGTYWKVIPPLSN